MSGPAFGVLALSIAPAFPAAPTDEFALGLNVGPGLPDDLNGLTYRPGIIPGFYYSLAPGAGPLPGDIFNVFGLYAPSFALTLNLFGVGTDDIDALLVHDMGIIGVYEPGIDFVAFSLSPGSLTLGAPVGYAPGGGDLLVPDGPDANPFPDIFNSCRGIRTDAL
jgi:hypothetical protein